MPKSFYDLDYYIEINEKRDTDLRAEYDKILGKVSNILIVYSGVSVFLFAICKDFFSPPIILVLDTVKVLNVGFQMDSISTNPTKTLKTK